MGRFYEILRQVFRSVLVSEYCSSNGHGVESSSPPKN